MEKLPLEIVLEIVSFLTLSSLRELRLVNRLLASSIYPLLFQRFAVLNTAEHLEELHAFLDEQPVIAGCIRQLTLYHATWPLCDRTTWERHPRIFGGKAISIGHISDEVVDAAFQSYLRFIYREATRSISDVEKLLSMLPKLEMINVLHIQSVTPKRNAQYRRLVDKIWLWPSIRDTTVPTLASIMRFANSTNVIRLSIQTQNQVAVIQPECSSFQATI